MTYHDFTPNGLPLLRHLEKALATSDPDFTGEYQRFESAKNQLSDQCFAESLEAQFAAKLLYVFWQGFSWNLECTQNPVNKLRLQTDYEELHGELLFQSLPRVQSSAKAIHNALQHFTAEQKNLAFQMQDYYSYLETIGFKLAHLWGFQRGNAYFPEVIPGYTQDMVLTARYARMVRTDLGFCCNDPA